MTHAGRAPLARAHDAPRGGQDSRRLKAILHTRREAEERRGRRAPLYVCMFATDRGSQLPIPTLTNFLLRAPSKWVTGYRLFSAKSEANCAM